MIVENQKCHLTVSIIIIANLVIWFTIALFGKTYSIYLAIRSSIKVLS